MTGVQTCALPIYKDFSIVGGVSEVKGATGFGKGKIEFGNKNLIKGISIGKEVKNPILRISNKEGLGEDNLKLSFSKIKSKPLLKYIKTEIGERRVGKECRSRWSPYH